MFKCMNIVWLAQRFIESFLWPKLETAMHKYNMVYLFVMYNNNNNKSIIIRVWWNKENQTQSCLLHAFQINILFLQILSLRLHLVDFGAQIVGVLADFHACPHFTKCLFVSDVFAVEFIFSSVGNAIVHSSFTNVRTCNNISGTLKSLLGQKYFFQSRYCSLIVEIKRLPCF